MDQEPHKAWQFVTRVGSLEPSLYVVTVDRQVSDPSRPPCWKADASFETSESELPNLPRPPGSSLPVIDALPVLDSGTSREPRLGGPPNGDA